ncbi:hypothetical protein PCANC_20934 [Puccinia coronata f. sp. avenae]|uniref:Uncharacterized protein n=1 Tax=Puccinia coronata f. sp. avenae TaxID=200324 RepID=A0A2N5SIC2_9BASI|nr:hypothetical protein PCANC_20934 [Puccinia coronata f. sp. avenae]
MTDGLAAFCERISLAFWEPFSIDSTRHVGAGAPDERSVNLKLNDLRTPGCTRGVGRAPGYTTGAAGVLQTSWDNNPIPSSNRLENHSGFQLIGER